VIVPILRYSFSTKTINRSEVLHRTICNYTEDDLEELYNEMHLGSDEGVLNMPHSPSDSITLPYTRMGSNNSLYMCLLLALSSSLGLKYDEWDDSSYKGHIEGLLKRDQPALDTLFKTLKCPLSDVPLLMGSDYYAIRKVVDWRLGLCV